MDKGVQINFNRAVLLEGEVTEESIGAVRSRVMDLVKEDGSEPIDLLINSPGGSVAVGLAFNRFLLCVVPVPVRTVTIWRAASMAVPIFMAGDQRVMVEGSTLFVHRGSISFDHEQTKSFDEIETWVAEHKDIDRRCADSVAERTGGKATTEKILELMAKNTTIAPGMALDLGLATTIAQPFSKTELRKLGVGSSRTSKPRKKQAK